MKRPALDFAPRITTATDGPPCGSFNSVVAGTATATTDANGNAVLSSRRSKKSGSVTFTVTNVTKSGTTYNAAANLVLAPAPPRTRHPPPPGQLPAAPCARCGTTGGWAPAPGIA